MSRHVGANVEEKVETIHSGLTGRRSPATRSKKKLPTRAVMARYDVSDRTIDRWVANTLLGFPQPIRINRRRYWDESALDAFDESRVGER
jgi:predicted DNA-binding transcriptional regulator AlpA